MSYHGRMDYVTLVRMVVTAISAFLIGCTLIVAVTYSRGWRPGRAGLLPAHVFVVSISYAMLLTYATIDVGSRVDEGLGLTWRIPLIFPAQILGLLAMWKIWGFRRMQ